MITRRAEGAAPVALVAALLSCVVPVAVIVGWTVDSSTLKAVFPGLTPMNPMTALCFLLVAVATALLALRKGARLAHAFGWSVFVIGSIRLLGYWLGSTGGPDTWLFASKLDLETIPNRMAPNTAAAFLLLGLGLGSLDVRVKRFYPSELLILLSGVLGLLTVIGYSYSVADITMLARHIPMALHTAALFVACSAGLLSVRSDRGFVGDLCGPQLGALVGRRLLFAVVVAPLALGYASLAAQRFGMGREIATAIFAVAVMAILSVVAWLAARTLNRIDAQRREAVQALERASRQAGEARADAVKANNAKSEFLSRMSHELRTPLNAVLGFAQLLEREPLTERQQECAQHILKGGKHLLGLINEILDISRIESGNLGVSVEPVELTGIVDQAIDLVRPLAESHEIAVVRDFTSLPAFVLGDRQRLTQIVLNLLSNAVKYNRPNGRVTIGLREASGGTVLTVSDTGHGIDEAQAHKLFVPFERLGADVRGLEGTGLGLALSLRLAEAMGCTLRLEQTSDEGSTFALALNRTDDPAGAAAESVRPLAKVVRRNNGPWQLLQIEDNPSNVRLMEQILEELTDCQHLLALYGQYGIAMARRHRPDIILLDLNLPDMHGSDVLRALRADQATRHIPIIVVSADATAKQESRLRELGADAYLTKPFDVAQLSATLETLLSQEVKNVA